MNRIFLYGLTVAGVVALASCATETSPAGSPSDDAAEEPEVTLVLSENTNGAGFEAIVSGTLGVNEQNCVTLDDRILVVPAGSSIDGDGGLEIPGYDSETIGGEVQYGGGQEEIPWEDASAELQECSPGGAETVLVTAVSPQM
ncbi:hypothetical protein [Microbacterium halotolerans]|uniref:hypothetical protein n=1 Tax=Microbacterium halotolerans TaxID=246613 RepID=UPI000E6A9C74|nr:hypothetical protein [Microbacterium halotolerans]